MLIQRKQDKMDLNEKFFNENFIKGIHKPEIPTFQGKGNLLLGKSDPS